MDQCSPRAGQLRVSYNLGPIPTKCVSLGGADRALDDARYLARSTRSKIRCIDFGPWPVTAPMAR